MMNLFQSFDLFFSPSTFYFYFLIFFLFSFPQIFFYSTSSLISVTLQEFFLNLIKSSCGIRLSKSFLPFFMGFFFSVLSLNFLSIYCYNFSVTTQIGVVFFVSFLVWASMFVFMSVGNPRGVISHFIPEGSPLPLSLFLFLIEVVSLLIRPLTLSIRLCANVLTGHLILSLLCLLITSSSVSGMFPLILMTLVEIAVAFIQSYIFVTLIALYYSELL